MWRSRCRPRGLRSRPWASSSSLPQEAGSGQRQGPRGQRGSCIGRCRRGRRGRLRRRRDWLRQWCGGCRRRRAGRNRRGRTRGVGREGSCWGLEALDGALALGLNVELTTAFTPDGPTSVVSTARADALLDPRSTTKAMVVRIPKASNARARTRRGQRFTAQPIPLGFPVPSSNATKRLSGITNSGPWRTGHRSNRSFVQNRTPVDYPTGGPQNRSKWHAFACGHSHRGVTWRGNGEPGAKNRGRTAVGGWPYIANVSTESSYHEDHPSAGVLEDFGAVMLG